MYAAMAMSLGGAVLLMLIATGAMVSGQQIWFTLGSTTITTNNTEIPITTIGEDADSSLPSLFCRTDGVCCRSGIENGGNGPLGQWTFPDGRVILGNGASTMAGDEFYINRNGPQLIRLGRRENVNPLTPTGSYCCTVPTSGGEMTLCANLVLCPSLTPLMDGVISYSDPTLGRDTVATHTCEAGSALTTDLSTRTCGVTSNVGVWSGSPLVCAGSACPDLTDLQNGVISYNTVSANSYRRVTTVATYSCDTGFELTGTSMRTCNAGVWDGSEPTCTTTLATCSDLTAPTNGMIAYDMESMNARPLNTVATYTCITGYMVTGDMTRTCEGGGVWSGTDPTCELPACPDLTLPANGGITYNPTTTPRADGSTATYTCTTGYQMTGLMVRMCSVSGWSTGDDPVCTAICPALILSNGMISFDPATSIILEGTVATHSCDTGYQLSSSPSTRTCQSDTTWSGDDITCQLVDCGSLDDPTNGAVDTFSGTTFMMTATYTCNTGYNIVGDMTRTCQDAMLWSGAAPTCDTPCPRELLSNGMVAYSTSTDPPPIGAMATYFCDTGYELSGASTRNCVAVSGWSTSLPVCNLLCLDLTINNGGIVYNIGSPDNRPVNTTATHACDASLSLVGEAVRTCGSTGEWSGSPPICVVACMDLVEPVTGSVVYDMGSKDSRPVGTMATYTCSTGYMVVGNMTCQIDRTWSDSATCELVCPDLAKPDNGNIVYSDTIPRGVDSMATYSCTTAGYQLVGITERMCTASGWSTGTDPTCIALMVDSLAVLGTPSPGLSYSLTCTVTVMGSSATPTFQWSQDGSVITVGGTRNIVGGEETTSPYTNTLTFSPIQQSHQGAYICQVTVDTVTASSPSTDVTVGVPTLMATLTLAPSPMAGQSYSLACTLTRGDSLNPTITYQFTQDNPGQTRIRATQANPILTFETLVLSDSGQYSCQATVTSPHLNTPQEVDSGSQSLTIQILTPSVSILDPGNLFATTSPTLVCSVSVDSSVVDVPVTASVEWDGPRGIGFFSVSGPLSGGSTTLSVPLTNTVTGDSGDYICRASVSTTTAYPQVSPSSEGSDSRSITVYGVPSAPSVTVTGSTTTTLTFSWTQPPNELVTRYTLDLDYRGDCPEHISIISQERLNGDVPTFTFGSIFRLQEFSDYQLTITGTNGAGTSSPVLETATTLPAAPNAPVQNLRLNTSRSSPISITIQWDRVPCISKNSDITGYSVVYTPPNTVNTVSGTDRREFTFSVFPRTDYTIRVIPNSGSGSGPSSQTITHTTDPVTDVSFLVNGELLPDNSVIRPDQFGEDLTALHCLTPYEDCCRLSDTVGPMGAGRWLSPTGDNVVSSESTSMLYMSRNPSRVSLNRDSSLTPAAGIYRCLIPVSESSDQTIHIGLYPEGQGAPTIPDELVFSRGSLTLTCVSNGGPASEVVWTRDGVTVSTGYTLTQTVTNTATATYENVLTATTIADLVGNFTCTVNNSRGTSNTGTIRIGGVRIIDPPQLTVGQSATLTCESDVPGTIEWLDSDMSVLATGTGSELDYTIDTVSDGMHGSTLICRAPGGSEVINFIVIVPPDILDFTITPVGSPTAGSEYSLLCEVSLSISGLVNTPTAVWTATDNDFTVISSGDASTLTFSPLRTSHGRAGYTCVGQLVSPALDQVMEDQTQRAVMVTIPTPGVSLTTPTSLTAGTPSSLTCTITVDTAVDLNVVVDIVWEISTDSDPITTATGNVPTFTNTLTIPILSTRYTWVTCRATVRRSFADPFVLSSSQESASVVFTVEVPPPPVVMISVSGDSVAGSYLSLLCTATPPIPLVTPPTISWIQQDLADTVIPDTSDPSASVRLTFNPLRTSRGGVYVCVAGYNIPAANIASSVQSSDSTTINVQIPRPDARFTFDPMMDCYTVGLFLTLGCEVTLSSAVDTVVNLDPIWRREGVVLTTGDQLTVGDFPMTSDDQVYTSLLEFQPLTRDFIGNDTLYECEASVVPQSDTFITGTTTNTSTTLTVGAANFAASISSNSTVLAGSEHTLMCQGVRGDDQADGTTLEVEWFNPDGVLITGETSDVMITGVTDITTDPTLISFLIFPSLQTSQAGPYTCRVNHTIPDTTITDQSILSSSVVTVQINTPQVMISASRSATLYEGTTGQVLRCMVTPDNAGVDTTTSVTRDITGGVDRDTTSDTVSDGVIIVEEAIQVLSLGDTGTYTCSATVNSEPNNMYIMSATNTDTLSITVEVLPVPVVEISPSSPLPVLAGSSLNLTCSVSVEDLLSVEPLIQWTLSDQSLSGILNGRTNTLTFDPLFTTNATQYTCTATINIPAVDITSTGSNSTNLTVDISPPTVSVSSPTPVYHGTSHTLSCNAGYDTSVVTTAVTLDYSWTGPNLIASSDSAALTLSPVDLPAQSSGDYTCTVSVIPAVSTFINPATDSDTYNLTVLAAPPPDVLTGVPVRVGRCGQVSSITCTASVIDNFVATPTFMWRGPGGDIVDSDNILNSPSVMTGGEYTCMACVNVPQVNITNLCTNSTITIQDTTPQPVSDVVCSSLSPSTLSVSWSPPTDPVLSYQVEVKQYSLEGSTVDTVSLSTPFDSENVITTITVDGLVPSTRYLVSVEAVSGVGCSEVTEIDCYTEQTQPPVVTGVTVDRLNGTAMNVSWTPLNKAQSNGFIQSYIVTYSVVTATPNRKRQGSQQVTVSSDKSGTIIGGLDPGSEYSVGVGASGAGGTSQSSPLMVSPTISPIRSVLFQLRLTNIRNCLDWVDQDGRIDAVRSMFAAEVESHCGCGFSSMVITSPRFRCFPESSTAVTFRATLTDSRLLTPIQDWIQTNGFISIQSVLIEVDKTCQVEISSLADTECNTIPVGSESSAAVIGGVVGGVVIVLIVAVTITVIVIAVLVFKSRREKLIVHRTTKRALPPVSLQGVVSTGEIKPYEMIEMGDHEYEEVSKFQKPSGGEYEMVGGPSAGYQNRAAIMATKQTSPPPPPPPQPSQQETVDAGGDFEVTECIAYSTTTHGPPPPNTTSGDPLYAN
ncbi:mucin-2-like isoform X4 [Halichondria panicea]|uniref:mucin-2-like isoform X4 n=1 Tax=Halichondria panicea TaxID=6063 RepID=UPI00312B629A